MANKPYKSHGYVYFELARIGDTLVYGQFRIEETKHNKHMDKQRISTVPVSQWNESLDHMAPAKGRYIRELNDLRKEALKKIFMGWL